MVVCGASERGVSLIGELQCQDRSQHRRIAGLHAAVAEALVSSKRVRGLPHESETASRTDW